MPERRRYRGQPGEVVDLVDGLLLQERHHAAEIGWHRQVEPDPVADAEPPQVGKRRRFVLPRTAVDLVALLEEEPREIGAVLP